MVQLCGSSLSRATPGTGLATAWLRGPDRGLAPRACPRFVPANAVGVRVPLNCCLAGTPDRARTYNLRLRRPTLYPVELRAHEREWHSSTPAAGALRSARGRQGDGDA